MVQIISERKRRKERNIVENERERKKEREGEEENSIITIVNETELC